VEPHERERERVQLDIVKLSAGSEAKVREYVVVAKRDYRDVLFWAEYPEDSRLDTPEKRKRVRQMFEKFGVEPPSDLWPIDCAKSKRRGGPRQRITNKATRG
jgi:hypothetical protein